MSMEKISFNGDVIYKNPLKSKKQIVINEVTNFVVGKIIANEWSDDEKNDRINDAYEMKELFHKKSLKEVLSMVDALISYDSVCITQNNEEAVMICFAVFFEKFYYQK